MVFRDPCGKVELHSEVHDLKSELFLWSVCNRANALPVNCEEYPRTTCLKSPEICFDGPVLLPV